MFLMGTIRSVLLHGGSQRRKDAHLVMPTLPVSICAHQRELASKIKTENHKGATSAKNDIRVEIVHKDHNAARESEDHASMKQLMVERGDFQQESVLKQLEVLQEEEKEYQHIKDTHNGILQRQHSRAPHPKNATVAGNRRARGPPQHGARTLGKQRVVRGMSFTHPYFYFVYGGSPGGRGPQPPCGRTDSQASFWCWARSWGMGSVIELVRDGAACGQQRQQLLRQGMEATVQFDRRTGRQSGRARLLHPEDDYSSGTDEPARSSTPRLLPPPAHPYPKLVTAPPASSGGFAVLGVV
ncbi:unnamed protein product [Boreogadus saida]